MHAVKQASHRDLCSCAGHIQNRIDLLRDRETLRKNLARRILYARQRLIQRRRDELAAEVAEARDAYRRGEVRRGNVADLMEDLVE